VKLLQLSLRNYRVFEEVDLELPPAVIGIVGENGAGKTSLTESIAFALYGVDAARTKRNEIRTQGLLTDCEVRLVFEHGGIEYEVRRAITGRAHTPQAELFAGGLMLASGTTDVEAEVQRLLHMDLRVFKASVFAEQKQLDAFSDVTAGRRKEMALRLLGIRPVDDARAAARKESRAAKLSADQLAGALADVTAIEAALKEGKDVAAEAKARAKVAAEELKAVTVRWKAAVKVFDDAERIRERVDKLTAVRSRAHDEVQRLTDDAAALSARLEELASALEELPVLEAELASLQGARDRLHAATELDRVSKKQGEVEVRLRSLPEGDAAEALARLEAAEAERRAAEAASTVALAEQQQAEGQVATAQERLARAGEADPSEPCPTCGQELGAGFKRYVQHCRSELSAAKKGATSAAARVRAAETSRRAAERAFRNAEKAGREVQEATASRAHLAEQLEELGARAVELTGLLGEAEPDVAALQAAAHRWDDLGRLVAALTAERKHLERTRADLQKAEARLRSQSEALAKLDQEIAAASFDRTEHARLRQARDDAQRDLESARDHEREAADAFAESDKDVRELTGRLAEAKEAERKVADLRSDARHIERVAMLLDGFRDHLVSRIGPGLSRESEALFRELTGSEYDDLRIDEENLAIHIADGETYHPIERFSGSEADLANLALRVAISTHLSRVSGADVGLMVLDEVLGSLDEERRDLMVQTLGRLAGRFHQLFVITHAERVKDQFPTVIQVSKVGRRRSRAVLI
jgi:DNA repair protein SbcC/Rad50